MKKCIRCGEIKDLPDFYKHKKMKDGHLNKCKDCTKEDSSKRHTSITSTPEGLEKERGRHRDKYHRLGYKEKQKEWDKNKTWKNTSVYKNLHRYLRVNHIDMLGKEIHHWNYNMLRSIFILEISFHKKIHKKIEFDKESKCFKINGLIIDSIEKHLAVLVDFRKKLGVECEITNIEL